VRATGAWNWSVRARVAAEQPGARLRAVIVFSPVALPAVTGDGLDLALVAGSAGLGFLAWRSGNGPLRFVAGVVGASVASGVLLFGFLAYPLLFMMARRRPAHGFGWILLLSVAGGTLLIARRLPLPELLPHTSEHATAVVTRLRARHDVWSTLRRSGQSVPQPYEEAEFDLTLSGGTALHLRDRVDSGSIPGLRVHAAVDVAFPGGQPLAARLSAGKRTWARAAFVHVLGVTAAFAAALLLLVWLSRPLRRGLDRLFAPRNGVAHEGWRQDSGRS
jgi:hypothetical protein